MRFLGKTVTLTFACIASFNALAASFSTPTHFEIMYVDKQSTGTFSLSKTDADLTTGPHQIVVRYSDNVGSNSNSEIIKSQPIVINLNVKENQDIVLSAKQPRSISKAKKFADKPTFSLKSKNGGSVDSTHYVLPLKSGMQFSRDYLEEIAAIEATQANTTAAAVATTSTVVAASNTAKAKPTTTASTSTTNSAVAATAVVATTVAVASNEPAAAPEADVVMPSGDNTELQMLQFWYQRSDAATRKAFQIWVIQQQ
ncbi:MULTISPECIES: YccT family protein [unclassified Agarivorans]|uniref:YccT family protein n=1 Tax=unclassified Agarivorans TaxID=2636026 RepID=UPI0026E4140A|nr:MULTISPECIES: DUF2057 domain-containing protein [unclassified Agarivorans]MDO6684862.1 DUF2057 domain-containing protein [Agarivorans sp. 3_MG-2023]MDO6714977.1 DUF2057 domain-containing protein [Agarivorans sp. 2_MG-2023]